MRLLPAAGLAILCALGAREAQSRVFMTQEQAIKEAFPPPATFERRTLYLDDAQARRAAESAGVPIEMRVVPYYVGTRDGRVIGYAYFDTHLVRTLPETVCVRLTAAGAIAAIDIVSFDEPDDYRVTPRWLEQFNGQAPEDPRRMAGAIRSLSGATLSARAVTDAARRVIAIHRLFVQPPAAVAPGGGSP
jgi:Na+-translocating ferredoxin:NAD+ oxidoreductase RnfG subunit